MRNLILVRHPLLACELTVLRRRGTPPAEFRAALRRASLLLACEVSRALPLRRTRVRTPLASSPGWTLASRVVLVPVLRAGLGMTDAFLDLIPEARVGHLGIERDEETLDPVEYYSSHPRALRRAAVLLLDPMLATGGSACAALAALERRGARDIRLVTLLAAPQGVRAVAREHPDVPVFTAALDRTLNGRGYIVPGLGDAGDRQFGTG